MPVDTGYRMRELSRASTASNRLLQAAAHDPAAPCHGGGSQVTVCYKLDRSAAAGIVSEMQGAGFELRAFRGSRRSSVYRAHAVGPADAERVRGAAGRLGLPLLASLEPGELDKREARLLADELTRLRASATLLERDDDLTALAEVASWCARANGRAWLRVS